MAHLVVVRSNRGGEGKTLVAQLLVEYLHEIGADWRAVSSAVREPGWRGTGAERMLSFDVRDTRAQVAFVDTVMRAADAWTVLDLAHVDNAAFLTFCDLTDAVTELRAEGVETISLRVYAASARDIRETFWADALVDAREILVLNGLNPAQLGEWRRNAYRTELLDERVPEFVIPRAEDGAVRHFLSRRTLLHDYLQDRSGSGTDVFARVQLAKLVQAFQSQFAQFLLSRDLNRLDDGLFQ